MRQLTHPGHGIHQRSVPQQTANHFHLTCSCCHVESCLTTLIFKDKNIYEHKNAVLNETLVVYENTCEVDALGKLMVEKMLFTLCHTLFVATDYRELNK